MALLLQLAAFAGLLLFVRLSGLQPAPLLGAALCGSAAALLSRFAGMAGWWWLIQFLFPPALVLTLTLDISPGFFLAAFLVMAAVYWSTFRTQVPLYFSSPKIWRALEPLLPPPIPDKRFTFIDLGCGIGGVLTHLAQVRPDGRYQGVEAAPLPVLLSWLRIKLGNHNNCSIQWGDLWMCDLAQYDVVFGYLSPVPMERLWRKARQEMRPGTLFISNTFAVPGQPPQQIHAVDDLHHSTLYIWRM
ncbi:MAG: class I SAM-dependent methyltransferase [Pseudomonadota bacterium]